MDVYERIDQALKQKGISRRKAAQLAGIKPTTLNGSITRKTGLSAAAVAALAAALDTTTDYLLNGEPELIQGAINGEPGIIVKWPEGHPMSSNEAYYASRHKTRIDNAIDKLNEAGQGKVADYAEDLTEQPKYQK